jgi:hypothetical protein
MEFQMSSTSLIRSDSGSFVACFNSAVVMRSRYHFLKILTTFCVCHAGDFEHNQSGVFSFNCGETQSFSESNATHEFKYAEGVKEISPGLERSDYPG